MPWSPDLYGTVPVPQPSQPLPTETLPRFYGRFGRHDMIEAATKLGLDIISYSDRTVDVQLPHIKWRVDDNKIIDDQNRVRLKF